MESKLTLKDYFVKTGDASVNESSPIPEIKPVPRRSRKTRSRDRATSSPSRRCHVSSRSSDSRFKHNVVNRGKAMPVLSICDVSELLAELERDDGDADRLKRLAMEAAKRKTKSHPDMKFDVTFRTLLSDISRSVTILERMKGDSQADFEPETWTREVVHFNAYESGKHYADLHLRSCSESNCLSAFVDGDGEEQQRRKLTECVSAQVVQRLLDDDPCAVRYLQSYGRHRCILCRFREVYEYCTDPGFEKRVTREVFLNRFQFRVVDVDPKYRLNCLLKTENNVSINYEYVNIDSIMPKLRWRRDHDGSFYVDFDVLFEPISD